MPDVASLLAAVKAALEEEGACRPSALVSQYRAWLGALVQAVEDGQAEAARGSDA